MNQVLDFLNKNTILNEFDYIVIGLSGGPDSMVLLYNLMEYRKKYKFKIVCAHVNHGLRKESEEEAVFVKKYCEENDIIFEMTKLNYDDKFSEALGHKLRYEFFDMIVKKYSAKYLFTAHHGDDLVETILMKIVRGANINGYLGFSSIVKNENYTILRPLVECTKDEILEYAEKNNIPFVIDLSNYDTTYTRNRYRKYILPKLKEEDSNVHLKFLQFSNKLQEYDNFINSIVDKEYIKVVSDNKINVEIIKEYNSLIIERIIYRWLNSIYKDSINDITKKHIESIIDVIYSDKPNIIISLPNYDFIKQYNYISIYEHTKNEDYRYELKDEVSLPNNKKIRIVSDTDDNSNYVTHLDSNNLCLPLFVRNYKQGDKMTIKNMDGHKKINDIFINEKINFNERDSYPVVVDSNDEIIWLPGIKKSAFDTKKDGKYDIILEYR